MIDEPFSTIGREGGMMEIGVWIDERKSPLHKMDNERLQTQNKQLLEVVWFMESEE